MIILFSSNALYPSHAWPNTVALMRAFAAKGLQVPRRYLWRPTGPTPPDFEDSVEPVFSRVLPGRRHVAQGQCHLRRFTSAAAFSWNQ